MNQPDLGLKVTELRGQKNMTQEKLAEYCEVSTRTIQRIESGDVEPRPFTRNSLSNILAFDLGKENTGNESLWLALLHLSSVFPIIFVALLLWSWKKDQSYKIDQQGRDVLNFQLTMAFVLFAFVLVFLLLPAGVFIVLGMDTRANMLGNIFTLLPPLPLVLLKVFIVYQGIVNAFRSAADRPIRYALSIPFVK